MWKICFVTLTLGFLLYPFSASAQYGKVSSQGGSATATATTSSTAKTTTAGVKATTSAKAATPAPQIQMKQGENVELFFDDFSIKRTLGGQTFCQMTFYVRNNTDKSLDSLTVNASWSGISTNVSFTSIPPNDLKSVRYALAGKGCYTMGEIPTLDVKRCLMRAWVDKDKVLDVPEEACKRVVVFK